MSAVGKADVAEADALLAAIPDAALVAPLPRKGASVLQRIVQRAPPRRLDAFIETVGRLVERGADVDQPDANGRTAIFFATANEGETGMLDALVALGADPARLDLAGRSALHEHARRGARASVRRLLELGLSPDRADSAGLTPLRAAVEARQPAAIDLLLERGADPGTRDDEGRGLVHIAAASSDLRTLERLIAGGVDIDQRLPGGETAVSILASASRWAAVRWLLERGADPVVPMKRSASVALHLAINDHLHLSDLVREADFDVNASSKDGKTALYHAVSRDDLPRLRRLIALGADVSVTGPTGVPAIALIARRERGDHPGDVAMIDVLLEHGANIDERVDDAGGTPSTGRTALMLAAVNGRAQMVRALLHRGADATLGTTETVLPAALRRDHLDVAEALLDAGIPIDFHESALWREVRRLAAIADGLEDRADTATIEQAGRLLTRLFEDGVEIDLARSGGLAVHRQVELLSNSDSISVLNALVKVRFVNEEVLEVRRASAHRGRRRTEPDWARQPAPAAVRRYPAEAALHVVGVRDGPSAPRSPSGGVRVVPTPGLTACLRPSPSGGQRLGVCDARPGTSETTPAEKTVKITIHATRPVVLALMSYRRIRWTVANPGGARIDGVVLAGYHAQRVEGIPAGVPIDVFIHNGEVCDGCRRGSGYFYAHEPDGDAGRAARERLEALTGRAPVSFQGRPQASHFSIVDR